ncbi:PREDICTED: papilin [Thamnophis sirtalis]|uniref:Papilin n=1 Tax=Thamnophis sirtalis TaxID=35019 RepID=A0A6I9X062_9SAUR|nr:PREDICTED: papilin [Thamnophis sirtalis]
MSHLTGETSILPGRHPHSVIIQGTGGLRSPYHHEQSPSPWVFNEPGEKPLGFNHQAPSPRHGNRHPNLQDLPVTGQVRQPKGPSSQGTGDKASSSTSSVPVIRQDDFLHISGSLGQAPCKGTPVSPVATTEGQQKQFLEIDQGFPEDEALPPVVAISCHEEGPPVQGTRTTTPVHLAGTLTSASRHKQQPDGALLISHLAAEDAGFFTCIASNGRDQDQKNVQIRLRGDLRIIDLLPRLSVSEGENAHLHCDVMGNNVNIRWSRNGVPVRSDGHRIRVSQDGSLFLNNVQLGDEGSYTCNAYSGNHSVSASTDVKVIKKRPEVPASHPVDASRECVDQPHLANCDLILQAQLCNNEYYSSFCCASCSRRYG